MTRIITRGEVRQMARSARDDAPTDDEFERMLKACKRTHHPLESRFLLRTLGSPSGMRAGTVLHLKPGWIDWSEGIIKIPERDPCNCPYCKWRARENSGSYEKNLDKQWKPKTEAGAREIPFWHVDGVGETLKEFMSEHGGWPYSMNTVKRRVNELGRLIGLDPERAYPHALRGTAGWRWARWVDGNPFELKAVMGWKNIDMALRYIKGAMLNGTLEEKFDGKSKRWRGLGRVLHTPEKKEKLMEMRQG